MLQNNFNLQNTTTNVLFLKKNIGKSIIALGQWLALAKDNLPAAEWMEWLKRDVEIPYVSAYRYIKVAKEIDYKTLEQVGISKVYEILELPPSSFRDELLALAPNLTRDQVQKEVKKRKEEEKQQEEGLPDEIKDKVTEGVIVNTFPSIGDADDAMNLNAAFLDSLLRVHLDELPLHYLDLLVSQLKKNTKQVSAFLERIENVKSKE